MAAPRRPSLAPSIGFMLRGRVPATGGRDKPFKKLNAALNKRGGMADTGERARSNVRHAVRLVVEQLKDRGPEEKAFAEHLQTCVSTGHECLYSQPEGRIWD